MMLHNNNPNKVKDSIVHDSSQTKTYDRNSVLGIPILPIVIGKTFFGKQANASKAVYSAIYRELPTRLIALVIVSIECCIISFKNGFRKDVQFSDATFQSQYKYYCKLLEDFKEKMPVFWKTLKEELRRKILYIALWMRALEAAAIAKQTAGRVEGAGAGGGGGEGEGVQEKTGEVEQAAV
ncbi:hypothetical protein EVG20_g6504 [Dentipellis fragilis]|uniref:DUF6532 domain-containing protein n=1 Tax=Dentipellis fragilis TaxID=205917 RepID=A0A4Y9YLG5_9AGAM|nr:hypothetical protein EVG20_g6504 [Dentipellis fragilis]